MSSPENPATGFPGTGGPPAIAALAGVVRGRRRLVREWKSELADETGFPADS